MGLKFLLCAIVISLCSISSAQDECADPQYQKIVNLEHLVGRWYAIGEADNFPQLKDQEDCAMYEFKRVDGNIMPWYAISFNSQNHTELRVRADGSNIFHSGSPTEGEFNAVFRTEGFEALQGLSCRIIKIVPKQFYIFYCCKQIEGSGTRHVVHFLSNEKFPNPDLYETMLKIAEEHDVPLDGMQEKSQEGCFN